MNILLGYIFYKNNFAIDSDNYKIKENNTEQLNINQQIDINNKATYDLYNENINVLKKCDEIKKDDLNINDKKIVENINEESLEITFYKKVNLSKKMSDFNNVNDINQNIVNDYIKNYNNLQNIIELCFNQIKENINEFINYDAFIYLFNLLEHDTINVLNGLKFLEKENDDINNIILKLDQWQSYQYKLPIFIEVLQNLMNLDFKIDCNLNPKTCQCLDKILRKNTIKYFHLEVLKIKLAIN
ncbi:hypothetical protein NAPIS_ORF02456 [Vairimorpha apis BRL 01]|uniref:Uncharacterized protein n=1 Tax=Vairimorpha apis BRL 01 TaxID=1037528 RepID=T0L647_9MICR|nr:hypothetical protein NAPIS_ORF02456 [Vairimorpha apis BRL 01]